MEDIEQAPAAVRADGLVDLGLTGRLEVVAAGEREQAEDLDRSAQVVRQRVEERSQGYSRMSQLVTERAA